MQWPLLTTVALALVAALAMHRLDPPPRPGAVSHTLVAAHQARPAPEWTNDTWLNTNQALSLTALRGRVVLLEFWTFACYNCTNTVPALRTLHARYAERGLAVVGMHTPEFPPFGGEHDTTNVRRALTRYDITWPNAMDNDRATWKRYGIRYWPSLVLIDKRGNIRYEEFGEVHVGDKRYDAWEARIEALLAE